MRLRYRCQQVAASAAATSNVNQEDRQTPCPAPWVISHLFHDPHTSVHPPMHAAPWPWPLLQSALPLDSLTQRQKVGRRPQTVPACATIDQYPWLPHRKPHLEASHLPAPHPLTRNQLLHHKHDRLRPGVCVCAPRRRRCHGNNERRPAGAHQPPHPRRNLAGEPARPACGAGVHPARPPAATAVTAVRMDWWCLPSGWGERRQLGHKQQPAACAAPGRAAVRLRLRLGPCEQLLTARIIRPPTAAAARRGQPRRTACSVHGPPDGGARPSCRGRASWPRRSIQQRAWPIGEPARRRAVPGPAAEGWGAKTAQPGRGRSHARCGRLDPRPPSGTGTSVPRALGQRYSMLATGHAYNVTAAGVTRGWRARWPAAECVVVCVCGWDGYGGG